MARIDTLIHEILSPVESAARLGPRVLGWLEPATAADTAPAWEWFDRAGADSSAGLEVTECHLPGDLLQRLFGPAAALACAPAH